MYDFSVIPPHNDPNEAQNVQSKKDNVLHKSERIRKRESQNLGNDRLNTTSFTKSINQLLEEVRSEPDIRPEIIQKFQNSSILSPLSDSELRQLAQKLVAEKIF